MTWRLNDIFVGIITGAICSVLAAGIEFAIAVSRVFSFGRVGGHVGSQLLAIAIIGAIAGGLVGLFLGGVFKPRPQHR